MTMKTIAVAVAAVMLAGCAAVEPTKTVNADSLAIAVKSGRPVAYLNRVDILPATAAVNAVKITSAAAEGQAAGVKSVEGEIIGAIVGGASDVVKEGLTEAMKTRREMISGRTEIFLVGVGDEKAMKDLADSLDRASRGTAYNQVFTAPRK